MRPSRQHLGLLAATWVLAFTPRLAHAADCESAIRFAAVVADQGRRALTSENFVEVRRIANEARWPAIDAARQARACGCADAAPPLADAALTATRADNALNLLAAQQFALRITAQGEAAGEALRRCNAR
jgi:hypothetical protein